MKKKQCILEEKNCILCGDCDRCDLNPDKICNNCEECLGKTDAEYFEIQIDDIIK